MRKAALALVAVLVAAAPGAAKQKPPPKLAFDQPAAAADPIGDRSGPYFHEVHAAWGDGLSFGAHRLLFEHSSVPDVLRLPGGRIFVYAVDGARRSRSGLMVGLSDDGGKTWKQGSLQVRGGEHAGADPEAVLLSDGRIRLYVVRFAGKPFPGGPPSPSQRNSVVSLISSDGVTFREEVGTRFEDVQITDPDVVRIGSTWFMYVSQGPRNVAATSTDGVTFTVARTIRENGSVSNTVPIGGGRYRQYYCGRGGIQSALTTDGLTFEDEPGVRISSASGGGLVCDPAPVKVGSRWLLIYKTGSPGLTPPPPKP